LKVVFLCGGIGRRMFPITRDKCLLGFLGKTLLEHQIDKARRAGLNGFVFVGNQQNISEIKSICQKAGVDAEYAVQREPKGMADALLSAEDIISGDEVLLVNPDDLFDPSLYSKVLEERGKGGFDSYITGYRVKSYFPGGYLILGDSVELKGIYEKPPVGSEPSDLVNIVVHLHVETKRLIDQIKSTKSAKDDVYERALTEMARKRAKVKVVPYDGRWVSIKYPWNILDAVEYFLDSQLDSMISSEAYVSDKATVSGKVIVEEGVKVLEGAVVKGPCYIGRNTVVGNNSLVRDYSHIGCDCVIDYSTEVKHSYIGNSSLFHSNYIGDSVISDNCLFGDRALTANVRLDRKTVHVTIAGKKVDTERVKLGAIVGEESSIGVGSLLMPGVKIGPKSVVGPGVVLDKDLEPSSKIILKQTYKIKTQ
jgi:bifunctional UDP-N-acetylglucosamine pyrophosphorylase/glucosamine-1-phosphate N-acetyltransferase